MTSTKDIILNNYKKR